MKLYNYFNFSLKLKMSFLIWKYYFDIFFNNAEQCKSIAYLDENELLFQKQAEKENYEIPPVKPEPPSPDECCGNGCSPCVFDIYSDAYDKYERELFEYEKRKKDKKN